MDRQGNSEDQFEKEWKEALDNASIQPPSSIWDGVEHDLANSDLASYKTKAVFYKWTAAAVIFIASLLGMSQYLYYSDIQQRRIISGAVDINSPIQQGITFLIPEQDKENTSSFLQRKFTQNASIYQNEILLNDYPIIENYDLFTVESKSSQIPVDDEIEKKEIYKVPVYHFLKEKKSTRSNEKYWAGVNVGSGSFDPNYKSDLSTLSSTSPTSSNQSFSLANNDAVDRRGPTVREGMSSGETIALGVNFGLKLSKKWTLESGLQYARADATTSTNIVIESSQVQEVIPASSEIRSIPFVETLIENEEVLEYDYKDVDLANQFQFATIPVKAGYLLLDNRLSLQLNAGFAANLYLGNTLSDPTSEYSNVTIGPGNSSPYRELSFSGLAGIELGYELLNRFDLVIEPNYRQSINSLTKETSSFTANPSGFGLMTGIRYKFN